MRTGFLFEVFSSFQGEGGSVQGSCFGKRQIFLRFAGCDKTCVWCDSVEARSMEPSHFQVYQDIVKKAAKLLPNPMNVSTIVKIVSQLKSPDLHSISFTGGEPLMQVEFVQEICKALKNFTLYLETNGSLPKQVEQIVEYFDYCCCDIKDESARATDDWRNLIKKELETIRVFQEHGKNIFAKVVFTTETKAQNLQWYARELARLSVPLVLQPASFGPEEKNFSSKDLWAKMIELSEALGMFKDTLNWSLSLQAHKFWKVL